MTKTIIIATTSIKRKEVEEEENFEESSNEVFKSGIVLK